MNRRHFLAGSAALACAPTFALAQSDAIARANAYAAERRGVSLLVKQRGEILFEAYPNGGGVDRGWELASGTKSFTGVIAAAAVQDRILHWDEPAADTLGEWRGDAQKRRITIRHLLSLTSGLDPGPTGRAPTYAAAVASPLTGEPGQRFAYGPAPFQVFGEIMRRKTGGDPLAYLTRRVLDPIGVRPTDWRRGRDGNPLLPQGAQLTARAWATFGEFVLSDGRGLVDREALRQCFAPSRANPGYGLSWWLLKPGLIPPRRMTVDAIDPAFERQFGPVSMAAGLGDQRLYIAPDLGLVVARQAMFRGMLRSPRWADRDFLRLLMDA